MRDLKALAFGLFLTLASTGAFAQCGTQAPANKFCGNDGGSTALATYKSIPAGALSAIAGGTVLGNPTAGLAVPIATTAPVLGIPGTSTGQVGLAGSAGGTAILRAQTTAGSAVSLLPTVAGTLVGSAIAPLSIGAATGTIALATPLALNFGGTNANLTASNGGIVWSNATQLQILAGTATATQMLQSGANTTPAWSTTTWPATSTINQLLYSSAANVISGLATANGGILNTSATGVPSITPTPLIGVANSVLGTIRLTGNTSGTVTITPQATAGAPTLTLPNASGTFAVSATAPIVLSATTGALTCPTCTTSAAALTANQLIIGSGSQGEQSLGTLGTTTTVLHGNAGGAPTFGAVVSADLNITTTSCTNQFVTAISAGAVGTCTTDTLASAQHANQGTTTTLLHGNAAGNPSFGQVVFADIASAALTTGAQLRSGTASTLVAADVIYDAQQTITFNATQTWDFSTFLNATETLTANITSLTCSNIKASQSGTITLVQDGTGTRTMVAGWCSQFRWSAGARGVLSTAINSIDALFYQCVTTAICYVSLSKAQAN